MVQPDMQELHYEGMWEDMGLIWPLIIIGITAAAVLLVDLVRNDRDKRFAFTLSALGVAAALLYDLFLLLGDVRLPPSLFGGLVSVDRFSLIFNALIYTAAFLSILLSRTYLRRSGYALAEYYGLLLMVVMGMNVIALAADLMVLFLGVELLSIPLYVLVAFFRNRRASVEAGLKYFLLGAFASGFLLYGIVLLYGATGSTLIPKVITVVSAGPPTGLMLTGLALIAIGLAFKIAAVPFHMWAPDVYEGAPTPITAFMATGVKVAGFAAIIRVFAYIDSPTTSDTLASVTAFLAVITMLVGNLGALPQTNIKRMLAYSSVAHAGYLLVGVAAGFAAADSAEPFRAVTYYLMAYIFMNVGAFGMVIFLHIRGGECNEIPDLAGLARKLPGVALPMAIFMFTLAGLPPSAGFFGKFYIFKSAVDSGMVGLAVFAVIMSVVSLYYYLRVITTMYFKPLPDGASPTAESCPYLAAVALISVAGVLILGVFPPYIMELLDTMF